LLELGAKIVDADEVYHFLLESSSELRSALRREFGCEYFRADGRLDRRRLGTFVFSSQEALARLNRLTHPPVIAEVLRRIEAFEPGSIVFLSAALLFEMGLDRQVDRVVLVYCLPEQQLSRLMDRDKLTEDEALRRISSQWTLERKRELADQVVDNSGSPDATRDQVAALYQTLLAESAN